METHLHAGEEAGGKRGEHCVNIKTFAVWNVELRTTTAHLGLIAWCQGCAGTWGVPGELAAVLGGDACPGLSRRWSRTEMLWVKMYKNPAWCKPAIAGSSFSLCWWGWCMPEGSIMIPFKHSSTFCAYSDLPIFVKGPSSFLAKTALCGGEKFLFFQCHLVVELQSFGPALVADGDPGCSLAAEWKRSGLSKAPCSCSWCR